VACLRPFEPEPFVQTLENLEMKKSLIALAALAATSAFAQFSIDGVMDAGFQSINYKGNKVNGIAGNGSATSQINFRGKQDLGGGMSADFRVETDWSTVSNNANTGTGTSINANAGKLADSIGGAGGTFGNGEIRTGLAGGFGRIDFGAVNYTVLDATLAGQPYGTAIGSGFRTLYVNDAQGPNSAVRADNSFKYTSPSFSGFSATLHKVQKQTKAVSNTPLASSTTGLNPQANTFGPLGAYDYFGSQEIGFKYSNGPLNVVYSNLKQDFVGIQGTNSSLGAVGTTKPTINTLGANYTMGNLKVFLLNQTNKTDTGSRDNKTTTVSATYTMGATTLGLQTGGTKNVAGLKSKFTGIGADYALSKTASIYLRNESIDDKAGTIQSAVASSNNILGSDTKFSRTGLGLRVAF